MKHGGLPVVRGAWFLLLCSVIPPILVGVAMIGFSWSGSNSRAIFFDDPTGVIVGAVAVFWQWGFFAGLVVLFLFMWFGKIGMSHVSVAVLLSCILLSIGHSMWGFLKSDDLGYFEIIPFTVVFSAMFGFPISWLFWSTRRFLGIAWLTE